MSSASTGSGDRPSPERVLFPIPSLTVVEPWRVGAVTLHPGGSGRDLIAGAPPYNSTDDYIKRTVHEVLDSCSEGSIAEVSGAGGIQASIDAVSDALSVLRLFQTSRRRYSNESTFGLPGDLHSAKITYVAVWDRSAFGGTYRGHHPGFRFDLGGLDEWKASEPFQYLSNALADPSDEGRERAVRGALLFDRASMEHRPDLRMLGFATALEAWVLPRDSGPRTKRLARHVSWFGCGAHNGEQCGRTRPICPYLHLSPDKGKDRTRLDTLKSLGEEHVTWRCSEWLRVMKWYEVRSDVAHGALNVVEGKLDEEADYWISRYIVPGVLTWLRDHPNDPIGDLQAALDGQPDPPNWAATLGALDANPPPDNPPP
jgi:hypothetical protein